MKATTTKRLSGFLLMIILITTASGQVSIGSPGLNSTIECPAVPVFTAPTASSACGGVSVNIVSTTTTGNSCQTVVTRFWNAADGCGNTSGTVSETITVVDHTPPTIGPTQANATISCSSTPLFTVPTASDACSSPTVNLLSSVTTGSACSFTITKAWDATDACGNHSATRSQTISVVNLTSPTIGLPGGNETITCGASPTFTPPTASDNCGAVTVNETTTTTGHGCFQSITKRWFAVDDCGHSSNTVSQTITIRSIFGGLLLIRVPLDFLNLAQAVQYLDTTGITMPTVIELEPGYSSSIPVVIEQIPGSSSTNTLTIRPTVDATGLVIGSPRPVFDPNSLTFFLPPPTLVTMDLQNASNVIIDGRPGGTGTQSQLTIQNFSVAGNAVRFVYGANNNCIKYCGLEGINSASNYTNSPAVVLFDSTSSKSNPNLQRAINTKDTILNCIIRGIGDTILVHNGIYSSGINDLNANNFISNNQIADFTNTGILVSPVGNGGNWTISGNSFYYDLSSPATTNQTAIQFVPGASADNNVISSNFIGGTGANAGGGTWTNTGANGVASFEGIVINAGTTNGAAAHNNIIQNVSVSASQTASFTGLVVDRLALNNGNSVGSATNANSIQVSGGHASVAGVLINSSYPVSITNDNISNISVTGADDFSAIKNIGSGPVAIAGNTIHNLLSDAAVNGILDEGAGNATISGNKINSITGNAANDISLIKQSGTSSANLTNNILSGNASALGITVNVLGSASLSLTAENDTITGFSKGFLLEKASGATLNTSIFDNAITGNAVGIDNETGTMSNATCNWWGSPNGPSTGQVSGNVIYNPWATIPQYVSVNAGPDQTIYIGYGSQSVTLTASAIVCGTPQYSWSTGAISQSISVSPSTTTSYIVSLSDAAGHKALDTVTVFVVNIVCGNNNDKLLMCHKGGTICIKKADVPDHLKQGDQLGSCPTGSITQAGVNNEEINFEMPFKVYPNPVKDKLKVQWYGTDAKLQTVEIFDLSGKKVSEGRIIQWQGINNKELDLSKLNNGTYMLKMSIGKEIKTVEFIIQR